MGEFLVAPLFVLIIAGGIWAVVIASKTVKAKREAETLPDEPDARRQEQIRRLEVEHEEARAEHVRHPARRP